MVPTTQLNDERILTDILERCSSDANGSALLHECVKRLPPSSYIRTELQEKMSQYEQMQLNGKGAADVLRGYL